MSIFGRLFKVMQSEAHSTVDKLENPIKMTEQGIRDLKGSLQEALAGLAQVKSTAIRLKRDAEGQRRLASEYERKAMLLLQKAQAGDLAVDEADGLATQALTKKQDASRRAASISQDFESQQKAADALQTKVEKLRRDISRYEAELVTLRARARTADSMKKVNKQLAGIDSSSTISMLEKMKQRVEEQEALAQAYGEITDGQSSVDQQIDAAIEGSETEAAARDSLAELKAKMGLTA